MEANILAKNYPMIIRQRNLFLSLLLLVAISLLLVSLKLFSLDEKIIMVPGLERELFVSNSRVSNSYLEQMTHSFANSLLDITTKDIQYKKQLVLKFTSQAAMREITDYFAAAEEEYKKFDLATHYTIKKLNINPERLEVVSQGILTSWFGKSGHSEREVSYRLAFEFVGGQLRLREFKQIQEVKK